MRSWKATRDLLAFVASCGFLMPPSFVVAQAPVPNSSTAPFSSIVAEDVALDEGGFLRGTVVDDTGAPQSDVLIYIVKEGTVVGNTSSQPNGEFQLALEHGGTYSLLVGNRVVNTRCWVNATAPPNASGQLLVALDDVYRGQIHPASCGLGSPWVIAGLATAAIVIPIALHNNRSDRNSSSE